MEHIQMICHKSNPIFLNTIWWNSETQIDDKQIPALLDGGAALQVILDVLRVGAVEPLALLVELHVPFVDVVDVGVGVVAAAPGEEG